MPPKNSIQLEAGTLFIKKEDGNLEPLGEYVQPVEIEAEVDLAEGAEPVIKGATEGSFEATVTWDPAAELWFGQLIEEGLKAIQQAVEAFKELVTNCCPNRRVAHLISHGKNRRIRKKNWRRAVKLILKEGATNDQRSTEKLPTTEE